jgi:hypothetical protein
MLSDLTFFLAWFENEYYIYQLRSKGLILNIYTSPLAIKLPLQKSCCKYFFAYCITAFTSQSLFCGLIKKFSAIRQNSEKFRFKVKHAEKTNNFFINHQKNILFAFYILSSEYLLDNPFLLIQPIFCFILNFKRLKYHKDYKK